MERRGDHDRIEVSFRTLGRSPFASRYTKDGQRFRVRDAWMKWKKTTGGDGSAGHQALEAPGYHKTKPLSGLGGADPEGLRF